MASQLEHSSALPATSYAPTDVWTPALLARAVIITVLLLLAFWPILTGMYASWFDDHTYMEHGLLVIPAESGELAEGGLVQVLLV